MPAAPIPTLADVDRITALSDPVLRNLHITQCYHELAQPLVARTGQSANWCTFATWASKQAGVTIRKEDLARELEQRAAPRGPAPAAAPGLVAAAHSAGARVDGAALDQIVWEAWNPLASFDRASDAVARGNRKVFAEIGRAFARFHASCLGDLAFDPAHIALFCDELLPGDPPDGQQYLRQAFTRYYHALFEPDPKARAELILLANIEIGAHEQTRLQPEILEAMDAPVPASGPFKRRLAALIFRQGSWLALGAWLWSWLLRRPTPLDLAVDALVAALQRQARRITTDFLMTLDTPAGRLRLGADLSTPFPPSLAHLANPDLLASLPVSTPRPTARSALAPSIGPTSPSGCTSSSIYFAASRRRPSCTTPPSPPNSSPSFKPAAALPAASELAPVCATDNTRGRCSAAAAPTPPPVPLPVYPTCAITYTASAISPSRLAVPKAGRSRRGL